jgi:SAM-dependent methyltransferase
MNDRLKEQWDSRYSAEEYIYGKEPNSYYRSVLDTLEPGHILLPGEGEGRNAVYAAKRGWRVTAFDISIEARRKAEALAKSEGVEISYLTGSFEEISLQAGSFDCIALIYVHMYHADREAYTNKLSGALKHGGTLLMEAFSKRQIENNSGGPKDISMLFSAEEVRKEFSTLGIIELSEQEIILNEGTFHIGKADVIRLRALKTEV